MGRDAKKVSCQQNTYYILYMGRNQVKIDNLPYNSDMHGQTSRPLGSFNEEKTHTQVNVGNIFSGEKTFTAVWFSQLTSTCASPPVT